MTVTNTGTDKAKSSFFQNRYEVYSFITASLLLALATGIYGIARGLKDELNVPTGGSELIAILKLFFVLPFMILFKFFYDQLAKRTTYNGRYYIIIGYFMMFFGIYVWVLLPNKEAYLSQGEPLFQRLKSNYPKATFIWMALHKWIDTLFYIHAEAVGTFIVSVLVWAYTNKIMSLNQANRHYTYLSLGGALATYLAGIFLVAYGEATLTYIILAGLITLIIVYSVFADYVKRNPHLLPITVKSTKPKQKLPFFESIKEIFSSENFKYLLCIFALVFCYTFATPLLEAFHKNYLRKLDQLAGGGQKVVKYYNGIQLQIIGGLTVVIIGMGALIRQMRWTFKALITPVIFLTGTIGYLLCIYFPNVIPTSLLLKLGVGGEHINEKLLVWIGLAAICLIKSTKYIFFDASKEAAYVPLDEDSKIQGKSFIDGIGSRLGKSMGGAFISILSILFAGMPPNPVSYAKGYISIALFLVQMLWLFVVMYLSGLYYKRAEEYEKLSSEIKGNV